MDNMRRRATSPDAPGQKCLKSVPPVPKRHRGPSRTAWNSIRPRLEELYIAKNMTLRDAMEVLAKNHDFRANENMYKKQMKAWGLQKHVKAHEKANAVAELVQNGPLAADSTFSRIDPEKLVRYVRSRVKSGLLDPSDLSNIERWRSCSKHKPLVRYAEAIGCVPETVRRCSNSSSCHVPPSLTPPDIFHSMELFMAAMKYIIVRERHEWLTGQQAILAPNTIFTHLTKGLDHLKADRLSESTASFNDAAIQFQNDIQNPIPSVSRITYCISSILWGAIREPAFLYFATFMARAALQYLGPDHAMTILLQHLQHEKSVEAQVRIWDCALNDYQLNDINSEHWFNMAQRRWRWCLRSGFIDDAQLHRDFALQEMARIGKLTPEIDADARADFDSISRISVLTDSEND